MKLIKILIFSLYVTALISCGGAEERKAVYLEKAEASIALGDLEKARIELKNVLQIDPKDGDAYYQLGNIYEQQKDYRKAYGNYLKAEKLAPSLLGNHAKLGRFNLMLLNDNVKAQEKVDLILSKEPHNSDGHLLMAALAIRNNNIEKAISVTEAVISREPNHIEGVTFLATLYMREKRLNDAISILDAALVENKNNEVLNSLLAVALIENKNYERAEIIYKEFLERNPDVPASYVNLARFYEKVENNDKAEKTLRALINNDPNDEIRILVFIKFLKEAKGSEIAIKELKSYIVLNKQLGKLRTALGELYILSKDNESAIQIYKDAIKDFPEEVTEIKAATALASVYISEQDFDKASVVIKEAMSHSPNDPNLNFLRAKLSAQDKDFEQAIISLRIVTKETPENIKAFLLLATIYEIEENKEQLKRTLHSAYQENKTNTEGLLILAKYQLTRDIAQAEKIIDSYNAIKENDYEGLSIKAVILSQNKLQSESYKIAEILMEKFPEKANGYLYTIPYLSTTDDKKSAISILEKGYLSVKDNRKLLIGLTSLQAAEKQFAVVEKRLIAEVNAKPDDSQLKILLAKVYLSQKKLTPAESTLKNAIVNNSENEVPYLLLSQIYKNNNDSNELKSILEAGQRNIPSSLKVSLRLAMLYEADASYDKAMEVYRRLNQAKPDNLLVMNNLASMLSDYSDDKEDLLLAKSLADKLAASGQPVFLDTVGWVYYKLGDYTKAVENLHKVIEKAPDVNIFNYHLGMAYKMAGNNEQAKVYLDKSIADGKAFKEKELAKAALKEL